MSDQNSGSATPPARRRPGRPRVRTAKEVAIDTLFSPRYRAFLANEISIEDLTIEELSNGAINDEGWNYARRPPEVIPREFALACTHELRRRMQRGLEALGMEAIDTVASVMRDGEGEQYDQYSRAGTGRLKAAQEVLNRVMGKVPDKVQTSVELSKWQQLETNGELIIDIEISDLPEE